jgi:ATPase subunit of ABC transporter with duplicated ATPase domains
LYYIFTDNTTNLISHLKTNHLVEYREVDHARSDEKKAKLSVASSSTESRQVTLQQFSHLTQQFSNDHPKQQSMTKKIAKMICCDLQPVSVVENSRFRELLPVAEPRYVIPSRKTITDEIIPQLYEETRKQIKSELSSSSMSAWL